MFLSLVNALETSEDAYKLPLVFEFGISGRCREELVFFKAFQVVLI
jgi:hypothetical protein